MKIYNLLMELEDIHYRNDDKPVSFYAFEMLYGCGIREGELLALTAADFRQGKATIISQSLRYLPKMKKR